MYANDENYTDEPSNTIIVRKMNSNGELTTSKLMFGFYFVLKLDISFEFSRDYAFHKKKTNKLFT